MRYLHLAACCFLCTLSAPRPVLGNWFFIPLREVMAESDLIVVGTLRGVREWSWLGTDAGRGTIEVTEVLWGSARRGDHLELRWENHGGLECARVEHRWNANKPRVWLLTRGPRGTVRADYQGRAMSPAQKPAVVRILTMQPVILRMRQGASAALAFRNATKKPLKLPVSSYKDGRLFLAQGTTVSLYSRAFSGKRTPVRPRAGAIVPQPQPRWVVVPPGGEIPMAEIDLSRVFALCKETSYEVEIRVGGYRAETRCFSWW